MFGDFLYILKSRYHAIIDMLNPLLSIMHRDLSTILNMCLQ